MPEGPEVKIITTYLSKNFSGLNLISFGFNSESRYRDGIYRENLFRSMLPLKLEDVICKGKQIFFCFCSTDTISTDNNTISTYNDNRIYLNSNLGMEGAWTEEKRNYSNFWLIFGEKRKLKTMSLNIVSKTLYYDDSRRLGNITLRTKEEFLTKWNEIGNDLLTENISEELWLSKTRNTRIKNKQICDFLMAQNYFSGIGNYIKCEILYEAKIKPDRVLSQLTDEELIRILYISMKIIRESYSYGGLTIKSFWDPEGRRGMYPVKVYGKTHDPYGNVVIKSKFKNKRTTHWVSALQI